MSGSRLMLRPLRATPIYSCCNLARKHVGSSRARQQDENPSSRRLCYSTAVAQDQFEALSEQRHLMPIDRSAASLTADETNRMREQFTLELRCLRPPFDKSVLRQWRKEIEHCRRQWDHRLAQHPNASRQELQALASAFDWWGKRFPVVKAGQSIRIKEHGRWLLEHDTLQEMRLAWETANEGTNEQAWLTIMLSTMVHNPKMTQTVFEATISRDTPGYGIDSVLFFVADRMEAKATNYWDSNRLLNLTRKILSEFSSERLLLSQRTILKCMERLRTVHVAEFYNMLRSATRVLRTDTLLHFVRRLSRKMIHRPQAFDIFKERIVNRDLQAALGVVNFQDPKFASVVTSLVASTHEEPNMGSPGDGATRLSPTDMLEFFMEQGFRPNIITLTALLDNLGSQGEVDEAFRLAQTFASAGIRFDERAISSLMKVAKTSLQPTKIAASLELASKVGLPQISVLRNALHSVLFFAQNQPRPGPRWARSVSDSSNPIFPRMLQLYVKKFDLWPLQEWIPETLPLLLEQLDHQSRQDPDSQPQWAYGHGQEQDSILSVVDNFISRNSEELLSPDATVLTTMLRAYIRDMTDRDEILSFFTHFRARFESRPDDTLSQHIRGKQATLLYDTTLLTMMEIKGMAKIALQLFVDLFVKDDGAGNQIPAIDAQSALHPHPPASILTWSIMIHGLFMQNENTLAKEFASLMHQQRIKLNLPTFNAMVKGYALAQDMDKTIQILQLLEDQGLQPNDRTMKAFGHLQDQSTAIKKMEQIIESNRKTMHGTS